MNLSNLMKNYQFKISDWIGGKCHLYLLIITTDKIYISLILHFYNDAYFYFSLFHYYVTGNLHLPIRGRFRILHTILLNLLKKLHEIERN